MAACQHHKVQQNVPIVVNRDLSVLNSLVTEHFQLPEIAGHNSMPPLGRGSAAKYVFTPRFVAKERSQRFAIRLRVLLQIPCNAHPDLNGHQKVDFPTMHQALNGLEV